jgi:hypothetical protein
MGTGHGNSGSGGASRQAQHPDHVTADTGR